MSRVDEMLDRLRRLPGPVARWMEGFAPGADPRDIARLEEQLAPLRLSEDVKAWYRRANGHRNFLRTHSELFPIGQIEERYREARQIQEYWIPALLPILYLDQGVLAVELDHCTRDESPVYLHYFDSNRIDRVHDSVATMLEYVERGLSSGAFDDERFAHWSEQNAALEAIRIETSPGSYREPLDGYSGRGTRVFELCRSAHWPEAWQRSIGRSPDDYLSLGATTRAARLHEAEDRPLPRIHAIVKNGCGTSQGRVCALSDAHGDRLHVLMPRGWPFERELLPYGDWHEITLRRVRPDRPVLSNGKLLEVEWELEKAVFLRQGDANARQDRIDRRQIVLQGVPLCDLEAAALSDDVEERAAAIGAAHARFANASKAIDQWRKDRTVTPEWKALYRIVSHACADPDEAVRRYAEPCERVMRHFFTSGNG